MRDFRQGPPRGQDGDTVSGLRPPTSANGAHPQVANGRSSLDGATRRPGQPRTRYGWLLVVLAMVVVTSGIWTEEALLVVGGVMIAAAAGRLLAPDAQRPTDRRTDGP
ncbi:MAG TPA: hypothetical protein VK028_04105 [Micromonosporaceae bacterium]|nr:hypothetical protein [Micromonosporaceae bacterium]